MEVNYFSVYQKLENNLLTNTFRKVMSIIFASDMKLVCIVHFVSLETMVPFGQTSYTSTVWR